MIKIKAPCDSFACNKGLKVFILFYSQTNVNLVLTVYKYRSFSYFSSKTYAVGTPKTS